MLGHFEPYEDDGDFVEFLRVLIERDELSGAALGVAKQVVGRGVESLSPNQTFVLEEYVIKRHAVEYCARGSCTIPWSEMTEALDNGGHCSFCSHMKEKIMNE